MLTILIYNIHIYSIGSISVISHQYTIDYISLMIDNIINSVERRKSHFLIL